MESGLYKAGKAYSGLADALPPFMHPWGRGRGTRALLSHSPRLQGQGWEGQKEGREGSRWWAWLLVGVASGGRGSGPQHFEEPTALTQDQHHLLNYCARKDQVTSPEHQIGWTNQRAL